MNHKYLRDEDLNNQRLASMSGLNPYALSQQTKPLPVGTDSEQPIQEDKTVDAFNLAEKIHHREHNILKKKEKDTGFRFIIKIRDWLKKI